MKLKQGGYLTIDHRAGPGLPRDVTERFGMPTCPNDKLMETDTFTCSHCPRVVVRNPDRVRPRAYCPKCDGYVCDFCEAERVSKGYVCNQTIRRADEHLEAAIKGLIGWPGAQSSITTQTPTATADTTALVDATYPFLLRGGTTSQRNGIWEIYIGGQVVSTSSPTYMVLGMDSTVGTGTNSLGTGQNDVPMDVLSAPDSSPALTGNTNATIDPQRAATIKVLNLSFNAYGGIVKWQTHDPMGRVLIYGNAANVGEISLSAFTGGTPGALGAYMIYESQ